jgi:hypothetical protein
MRKTIAGVGLAAGAAVALTACGGQQAASGQHGSQQAEKHTGDVLAAAYHATESANSAKISLKATTHTGGKTVHTKGHGAVQFKPPKLDLHITGAGKKTEERLLDGTAYVKTPQGKWLEIDVSKLTGRAGAMHSPTEALTLLRGASNNVTKLGPATIDGKHTTGYKAVVNLDKVASKASSPKAKKAVKELEKATGGHTLPIKVWIDGQHRLVREKNSIKVHLQGKNVTTTSTTTLSDYGTPVHVTKPPAGQVTSVTASIPPAH